MISLSYYQLILFTLLVLFSFFTYRQIKSIMFFFKIKKEYKALLKKKEDSITKMKKEGRFHKWITLPVRIPGKGVQETTVCEETGYCPSVDGFIDLMQMKEMLIKKKNEEEFAEFRKERIKELSSKYGMHEELFEDVVNDIYSIKKDFHVDKMNKSIKELKEQFGDNVKIVSSMDELEEFLKENKDEPIH